ncbi:MAG TPA: aldehyde dehydrogenase, partial [Rhodobacteraceae bacterium]|nr:aldehyde dehydrogenase [Paracoccaceae bacterium]
MHQEQIDSLREMAIISPQIIIGGRGVAAISGAVLDVVSPINGQV